MEYSTLNVSVATTFIAALLAIVLSVSYQQGYLDPAIESIAKYLFKAKAKAEEAKLQAKGLKEGQDFLRSELKGNKQASEAVHNLGGVAGFTKGDGDGISL